MFFLPLFYFTVTHVFYTLLIITSELDTVHLIKDIATLSKIQSKQLKLSVTTFKTSVSSVKMH